MVALGKLGFSGDDYRLFVKVLAHFIRDISFEVYTPPSFKQPALAVSTPAYEKHRSAGAVRYRPARFFEKSRGFYTIGSAAFFAPLHRHVCLCFLQGNMTMALWFMKNMPMACSLCKNMTMAEEACNKRSCAEEILYMLLLISAELCYTDIRRFSNENYDKGAAKGDVSMENLILSFNVVLPLFLCISLGYFLKKIGMCDEKALNVINKMCFKVFLPIYLFQNIYTTDLSAAFNAKLIAFAICGLIVIFFVLMFLIPKIERENSRRGVLVQAMFRSNFALFGLPVALSLCGEELIGPTSVLLGLTVPVFNVLAVISLETFRGGKPSVKKMLKGIVTNPLIIASVIGILFYFLKIQLPYGIEKSVTDLGRVATPLSLVALGGSFTIGKVKGYTKQLLLGVLGRLVVVPAIMIGLGIVIGLRNEMLIPVMIMFGAPTAVSSFPMAQQMGGDGELAAELVVFSSGFAIVTIFLWTFLLKQGGFI